MSDKISTLPVGETRLKTSLMISVALENSRGKREQSVSEGRELTNTRTSPPVLHFCDVTTPWTRMAKEIGSHSGR